MRADLRKDSVVVEHEDAHVKQPLNASSNLAPSNFCFNKHGMHVTRKSTCSPDGCECDCHFQLGGCACVCENCETKNPLGNHDTGKIMSDVDSVLRKLARGDKYRERLGAYFGSAKLKYSNHSQSGVVVSDSNIWGFLVVVMLIGLVMALFLTLSLPIGVGHGLQPVVSVLPSQAPITYQPVVEKTVVKEIVDTKRFADCIKVRGVNSNDYVLECETK